MKAMKRMMIAAGFGAVVAHLWDPDRGRARRARLRDQTAGRVRQSMRRVERARHRISSDLYGWKQRAQHANGFKEPIFLDDGTLADKVRSEVLGRQVVPKGSLTIDAHNGTVALRGQVRRPGEIRTIERMVREIDGVYDVDNLLHTPATAAPNKVAARRVTR